jgi:acyl carrier protein
MNDARTLVRSAIARVAPDVDPSTLSDESTFRDEAGLDSMDFLNVLTAIAAETGVDVPERDYPRVTTIGALADYVERHRPAV